MTTIDKGKRITHAREALAVCAAGEYRAPSGRAVSIRDALERARARTRSYPPTERLAVPVARPHATTYEVANETTIASILRAPSELGVPCALNFASAKNPGGGFLGGAEAQEESLARSSALFACIDGDAMYAHHRPQRGGMYTHWAIFSPAVPVFRGDGDALLEEARVASFLTCAAPNAGVVLRDPGQREELSVALRERIDRVLTIAALHETRLLILGAWGCGVFKNDPEEVAELFRLALEGSFKGAFEKVVFAVLDGTREERFLSPFRERFGP